MSASSTSTRGSTATVSRFSAVAKIGPLEFSGFIAWRGQRTITDHQAFARLRLEQLAELAAEARGSAPDTSVAS